MTEEKLSGYDKMEVIKPSKYPRDVCIHTLCIYIHHKIPFSLSLLSICHILTKIVLEFHVGGRFYAI